jgi:hypothetical protein
LGESFNALGFEGEAGWRAAARIKVVLLTQEKEVARETVAENLEPPSTPKGSDSRATSESVLEREKEWTEVSAAPDTSEPFVCGIPRELWSDPDVRWLTGVHDAGESTYVVCEPYEELLWWLQMPKLLTIAGKPSPSKSDVQALSAKVHEASAAADRAGYRLQAMMEVDAKAGAGKKPITVEAGVEAARASDSQRDELHADPTKAAEELPVEPKR